MKKEFIKALKCVLIYQLICWGVFILCDENKFVSQSTAEGNAIIGGIILLIGLLILYFVYVNKFIAKNNLNSKKFNIFLFILWVITSILISFILLNLVGEHLHICRGEGWDCFLNGIEYGLQGIFMVWLAILILIIKIIIKFYKKITKSKKM